MPGEPQTTSSMPASSSAPVNLTTIAAVESFLAGTQFASTSVVDLLGGTGNYAYRIHLVTPLDGCDTVVLKHAQPHIKDYKDLQFDLGRQKFEVEALTRVKSWLSPTSLVTVPKIYHFDMHNNAIFMEDCGSDSVTLKQFLLSGQCSSQLAETIGTSLGEFVASMHDWSRSNPGGILDHFDSYTEAKKLSAWVTYGRLLDTLKLTGDDVPSMLLDPNIEVNPSDIQVISKIVDQLQVDMVSASDVFVMGDFWPGNMMVKLSADTQQLSHIFILDWELAKTGIPGVELGQFCAEMYLLTRFHDGAKASASTVLSCFLETYSQVSKNSDHRLAQDTLAQWGSHLIAFTPRIPWGDKSTTQEVVKEGVQFLVGSRNQEVMTRSPVQHLLPSNFLLSN